MTARLVVFGGVQVVEGGVNVVFGTDSPTPPISPTMGFDVYRNGSLVVFPYQWDNHQLASINLPTATADATVAVGSMTVPGDPGWVAGDRITFKDDLGNLLWSGYVMSHGRDRNLASPTEVETTWQLFDVNRQLIGRKVVDWVRPEETSLERLLAWIAAFTPPTGPLAIDLDLTYIYGFGGVTLPAKTYTGDGITDLLADLILYTGYTIFLVASQTENRFQFHYSQPAVPLVTAGLTVTDVAASIDEVDVWGLTQPHAAYEAADMKNDVTGQNGTQEYASTNPTSISSHNAGGLFFQQVVQYSVDFVDLQLLVNNILNPVTGAGEEKPTYTFAIENLTGTDVIRVPPGSAILITSGVLGISGVRYPITHHTLSVSKDQNGTPIPGFWDVALEVSSQLRHPSAVLGYGGQGGDSGRLSEDFSIADHINVTQPDQLPPVGYSMIVEGQIVDDIERAVKNKDVTVNWTLDQWQDDAGTIPSTAWSLDDLTTQTDADGIAVVVLSHDTSDPWAWIQVSADL